MQEETGSAKSADVQVVADVPVLGASMLHPKMLEVIDYCLKKNNYNDVQAIFVSNTGPTDMYGEYCKHTRSFVISLKKITEKAIETAMDDEAPKMSITAQVWINIIYVILHEIHHNTAYAIDWDATEADKQIEEDLAHEYALSNLEEAIIMCNAEVPKVEDFPVVGEIILSYLLDEVKDGLSDPERGETVSWAKEEKSLLDRGIVVVGKDGDIITSLVDYYKATGDPSKWTKEMEGEEIKIVKEEVKTTNLFDKKILPGEQLSLLSATEQQAAIAEANVAAAETRVEDVKVFQEPPMEMAADFVESTQKGQMTQEDMETLDMAEQLGIGRENEYHEDRLNDAYDHTNKDIANPNLANRGKAYSFKTGCTGQPIGITDILRGLYMRLYNHMFSACGFNKGYFNNPQAVFAAVGLAEIEKASGLIIGCRTIDSQGQQVWENVKETGTVRGILFKNGSLPSYDLLLNVNGSARKVRMIAQNAAKGSKPAIRALAGSQIVWIIDADNNKYGAKIENGQYEVL